MRNCIARLRRCTSEKGIGLTTLARMWILEKMSEVKGTGSTRRTSAPNELPTGLTPTRAPKTKKHGLDRDELVRRLRQALSAILKDRPVKLAYL